MSSEYEFFSKDYIKFYFLNEAVNNKTASFKLFLESDGVEKDFLDVRTPGRNVYRFNNFNVSEDATNNCITFRPNVIGCYVYFAISASNPIRVEIIKNGTNTVAESFELETGDSKIEFQPQGIKKYDLKIITEHVGNKPESGEASKPTEPQTAPAVNSFESDFSVPSPFDVSGSMSSQPQQNSNLQSYSSQSGFSAASEQIRERERAIDQLERSNSLLQGDIDALEKRKNNLEKMNQELIDKKRNLTIHLDKLQEEYDKNYSNFSADVEEISSRYHIDSEILKLYADREVTPIEELLERAENDVKQIEEQICVFVEAQERKTAEIESELKIGKKE